MIISRVQPTEFFKTSPSPPPPPSLSLSSLLQLLRSHFVPDVVEALSLLETVNDIEEVDLGPYLEKNYLVVCALRKKYWQ